MFKTLISIFCCFLTFHFTACHQSADTNNHNSKAGVTIEKNEAQQGTKQSDKESGKQVPTKNAVVNNDDNPEANNFIEKFDYKQPIRVFGTEPFWHIKINGEKVMLASLGMDTTYYTTTMPRAASGRSLEYYAHYTLKGEKKDASLVLRRTTNDNCLCNDGMSDNQYSYFATFISEDRFYEGCAYLEK